MTADVATRRHRVLIRAGMICLFAVALSAPGWAQEQPTEVPVPTPTPAPTPIPAAEIPATSGTVVEELKEIAAQAGPRESIVAVSESVDEQPAKIEALEAETEAKINAGADRSTLEELDKRWLREDAILAGWLDTLTGRAEQLEASLNKVREIDSLWQLTLDSAEEQELPEALVGVTRDTLREAKHTLRAVSARRDQVLTLQTEVSKLRSRISEGRIPIREGITAKTRSAYLPSQPPIWRAPWHPRQGDTLTERLRQSRRDDLQTISMYAQERPERLIRHLIVFIVSAFVLAILGRRARRAGGDNASFEAMTHLLSRPIASAVLVSALIGDLIHPQAPTALLDLLAVLTLMALLRLLPPILPKRLRPGLILLVGLFLIERIVVLVPQEVVQYRLGMLVLAATTAAVLEWLVRRLGDPEETAYPRWVRVGTAACRIASALMVVAAIAEIIGSIDIAELLIQGVLVSAFAALLLWTGAQVVRGAVAALLSTGTAQRFDMARLHASNIQSAADHVINFAAVVAWFSYALHGFGLRTEFKELISKAMDAEFTVFEVTIQPFLALPLLLAVWLTFKISKFVNFVLADDVLPKLSLPRGVPNTILRLAHYLVLTAGFLVIVSMLGLDLTKFAIIAGALSVGIGFGLQNVVNNFVSGLILLFERPIKEGDNIEVGAISGKVTRIGTRASIVRTWQGAEVIVPNATLISSELVNWTLYDLRRRIDIPIGVAYGTNPDEVIRILREVAEQHPGVIDDPPTSVQFNRFGDSSLDFELRAWTADDFVQVGTELRVNIVRALDRHGIEIPFPQRDLHIRSAADAAAVVGPATAETDIPEGIDSGAVPSTDPEGLSGPSILGDDGGNNDR